jgi:hypothetical protein
VIEVVFEIVEDAWDSLTSDPLNTQYRVKRANIRYDKYPYEKYLPSIGLQVYGTEMIEWALSQVRFFIFVIYKIFQLTSKLQQQPKFPFIVDTTAYGGSDNIRGNQILHFHNAPNDPTFLREVLTSWIYIDKLCSPYSGFGNVTMKISSTNSTDVRTEYLGLYTIIEGVSANTLLKNKTNNKID